MTERREIDRTNSSNVLVTDYAYDSRGNLGFVVDAESHPTRYVYDLASRLVKRERALSIGGSIDTFTLIIEEPFAYEAVGRLTSLTDDNAGSTTYGMNARDEVTSVTYPDSLSASYTFDANGNVATTTDQAETVVTNTYDARNRLTSKAVSWGSGVVGTTAEAFTYDALDRLLTAVDDDFQVEHTFDSVDSSREDEARRCREKRGRSYRRLHGAGENGTGGNATGRQGRERSA